MNPGGDYGKKELSPALSNRFTTIWVPAMEDETELKAILEARLTKPELRQLVTPLLLEFWRFYKRDIAPLARQVLSVRDLLTWIEFLNSTAALTGPYIAYAHGAHVAFLDGIGLGVGLSEEVSLLFPCLSLYHQLFNLKTIALQTIDKILVINAGVNSSSLKVYEILGRSVTRRYAHCR